MKKDYRYELKFILDNARLSDAMRWLYNYTHARESYQPRRVNSLYFDDVDFSSVGDNLAGVSNRRKMRLRWYGDDEISTPCFELKYRDGRLGYKKSLPINSLRNNLLETDINTITKTCEKEMRSGSIILDKTFIPSLQVSYDREYYEELDGIRITIDKNIQFHGILPYQKLSKTLFTPYPYKVMEIKFKPHLKSKVSTLIKPLHITPTRHSKYLVGLATLGYAVYI